MTERDEMTDRLCEMMGQDPAAMASEDGRRRYGDAYGKNQRSLAKAVAMGGDPSTLVVSDGAVRMKLVGGAPPVN